MIETGLSCIDGLNTLVKGQKLPIFSCAGLPSREIAARILEQARTTGGDESGSGRRSTVVFVALGLAYHEYAFYRRTLEQVRGDYVAFINLAKDPVVERLLAPRFGLTVAEYLAFEHGRDVLVVVTDMTNYCDALREVSTAREELPGRRGYPGYLYSDLASLYERAGRIKGSQGSVTMLPIVTMPEDDITHPIPDLTGYITEGQIVLSRELHQRGVFPPVDVLPSLSRLMQRGIGKGRTREDHRAVANALYMHYATGRDLRRLEAIVGREGLSDADKRMLDFADAFEREVVHQGAVRRTIGDTLDTSRALLERFGLRLA
jgi:V/A-type H+-transporting ATPase subunit B